MKPYLPSDLSMPILDLGCGTGKWALKLVRSGYRVACVDISGSMLGRARRKIEEAGAADRATFHHADLCDLSAMPKEAYSFALALGDPRARARCMLLYWDGERRRQAEGETRGSLVLPPRGEAGFGWDPVFQPDGESRTYGELTGAEKDRIGHRGRAWRALLDALAAPGPGDPDSQAAGSA